MLSQQNLKIQLTMPMHANWQAAQFLKLAGPVNATRQQSNLADHANRVIGGR